MRIFLLSIFWVTTVGSVIQLLIIASGCWIVLTGAFSFSELSMNVFITQFVPWLLFLKTLIVTVLGELGWWLLEIPIVLIATLKFIVGTAIGLWAYSVAKVMPVKPVSA